MSISNWMSNYTEDCLVIPCAGKMFRSSVSKDNQALCFVLNKGYFQTTTLNGMVIIHKDIFDDDDQVYIKPVGRVDKIRLKTGEIVYRQRVFFHSITRMVDFCKGRGLDIQLSSDFRITIKDTLNCLSDLAYLEQYAMAFDQTIDEYLTQTCKIQLYNLLSTKHSLVTFMDDVEGILSGKVGYLERAPFLNAMYNIEEHTSALFVPKYVNDERIYTTRDLSDITKFGYTESILKSDRKAGVFGNGYKYKRY